MSVLRERTKRIFNPLFFSVGDCVERKEENKNFQKGETRKITQKKTKNTFLVKGYNRSQNSSAWKQVKCKKNPFEEKKTTEIIPEFIPLEQIDFISSDTRDIIYSWGETPNEYMHMVVHWKANNIFEEYLLALCSTEYMKTLCSDGRCEAGTLFSGTNYDGGENIARLEAVKSRLRIVEGKIKTYAKFTIYGLASVFSATRYIPEAIIVPFSPSKYVDIINFLEEEIYKRHGGIKKGRSDEHNIYPDSTILFFMYFVDPENRGVLVSDYRDIVDKIDKLFPALARGRRSEKTLLLDSIDQTDKMDEFPYQKGKITNTEKNLTQGIKLTDRGAEILVTFLGMVAIRSYSVKTQAPAIKFERGLSPLLQIVKIYETICQNQEQKLTAYKEWVPYTLSRSTKTIFPRFLHHQPQSLSELNIRLLNGLPTCSACSRGYETYYGATKTMQNAERDPKRRNDRGLCVRLLDDILQEAGVNPDEERNNPWYINFIGTWQQAERRLNAFKQKQQEMFDDNDPAYSFVDYYYGLLMMKLDYSIKYMANISNQTEASERTEEEIKAQEQTWAKWLLGDEGWLGKIAGGVDIVKRIVQIGGLLIYKVIGLLLQSPMVAEIIIELVTEMQHTFCRQLAIKTNKVQLTETDAKGELTKFDFDTGTWLSMSVDEQNRIADDEKQQENAWWARKSSMFFGIMTEYASLGQFKKAVEGMQLTHSGTLDSVLKMFENIPIIGKYIETLGTGKIKIIVIGGLTRAGENAWNNVIMANRRIDRLKRLFQAVFMAGSDCLSKSGMLTIKNGIELTAEGEEYYGHGFTNAIFNIPYYALIVLAEEQYRAEHRLETMSTDAIIDMLIKTNVVGGSKRVGDEYNASILSQVAANEAWAHMQEYMRSLTSTNKSFGDLAARTQKARQEYETAAKRQSDEQWQQTKQYIAYATLFAGVVAVTVATGGAAAAAGAASSAVSSIPTAVGSSVATTGKTLYDNKENIARGIKNIAGIGVKATELAATYPKEAVMVGGMIYMGAKKLKEKYDHWGDDQKMLIISDILKQSMTRELLFKDKLRGRINQFRSITENKNHAKYAKVQEVLRNKRSVHVIWPQKVNINLDEVYTFFARYGKAANKL
jgi:hypothetical protein